MTGIRSLSELDKLTGPHPDAGIERARAWTRFAYQAWCGAPDSAPSGALPLKALGKLGLGELSAAVLRRQGDPRAEALRRSLEATAMINLTRLHAVRRIAEGLAERQIDVLAFKGFASLVRFCEGNLGLRRMADVDLLVRWRDFVPACEALVALGYRTPVLGRKASRNWAAEASFRGKSAGVELGIDLHRTLYNWPLCRGLQAHAWESVDEARGVPITGPVPSVLIVAAHRAKHAFAGDLRELVDLGWLIASLEGPQWVELVATARRLRLSGALYGAYRQAVFWLGPLTPQDEVRLDRLARELGPVLRASTHWVAPLELPLQGRPRIRNHILGTYGTLSFTNGRVIASVAAPSLYFATRIADYALDPSEGNPLVRMLTRRGGR